MIDFRCVTGPIFVLAGLVCSLHWIKAQADEKQPRISIVVGQSLPTEEQDNAPASPGKLKSPFGIDFDGAGNMYIVELEGGRVHKLDTAGRFTTIAGDGSQGYEGDGGPARHATFNGMHNVAVTPAGDLYIADSWNHCVRKIDARTGVINTFAGTGQAGYSGDGGPARKATFNYVMCVSLSPANDKIYLADLKNRRIRVVDLESGTVETVAGNGEKGVPADGDVARLSPLVDPRAVAVDSQDNVYVLERGGHALRLVTPDGRIRTVVGTGQRGDRDGPGHEAQLGSPKHIAIDLSNNVIIADDNNQVIRKYDPRNREVTTIVGRGLGQPPRFLDKPHGVCVREDGTLFVIDTGHDRILRVR